MPKPVMRTRQTDDTAVLLSTAVHQNGRGVTSLFMTSRTSVKQLSTQRLLHSSLHAHMQSVNFAKKQ